MNERQLPLLLTLRALLRLRSVRETAHELGVSDATVSRRLSELRDWTGDPLLIRVGSALHPTERALQIEAALPERLNALAQLLTSDPVTSARPVFTVASSDAFHWSASRTSCATNRRRGSATCRPKRARRTSRPRSSRGTWTCTSGPRSG